MHKFLYKIIFISFCFFIVSCGASVPEPSPIKENNYNNQNFHVESLESFDENHDFIRYYDDEADVVCWIAISHYDGSTSHSCIPLNQLPISFLTTHGK